MIYPGLVSISFRKLSPEEIISLCVKGGLEGIEWGGDIHVPHGDLKRAEEVKKMTEAAGLKVAAYGSYYSVGCSEMFNYTHDDAIESAAALGAPTIRIWAGKLPSAKADEAWWSKCIEEARLIAEKAAKLNIKVSFEYHRNTLTDTPDTAVRLVREVAHENIYSYWQPAIELNKEERLSSLKKIAPWLTNLHVYYWEDTQRMPLEYGSEDWKDYFGFVNGLSGDRYAMLEFVKDDSTEQLLQDAAVLRNLLK